METKTIDNKTMEKTFFIVESMNEYIARISTGKKTITEEQYMQLRD